MDASLKLVSAEDMERKSFKQHLTDAVILTHDHQLLLQQRPENWGKHAGVLNIFGGHVEQNETVLEGLARELHEELGAIVRPEEVLFIGALTEDWTDHAECVHIHFWHDKNQTITGCYEAEAHYYKTVEEALQHPKIMPYAAWALQECVRLRLLHPEH